VDPCPVTIDEERGMKKIFANARELEWVDGPYPNVKMKVFPSEMESGTYTILLDLPPGAVLERHDEPLNEVSYVLSGTLTIEGKQYGEGTYLFTPAGMAHGPFDTEEGCLILVTKFSR
jgi:quercetin dioxygenase-like cupin family protein